MADVYTTRCSWVTAQANSEQATLHTWSTADVLHHPFVFMKGTLVLRWRTTVFGFESRLGVWRQCSLYTNKMLLQGGARAGNWSNVHWIGVVWRCLDYLKSSSKQERVKTGWDELLHGRPYQGRLETVARSPVHANLRGPFAGKLAFTSWHLAIRKSELFWGLSLRLVLPLKIKSRRQNKLFGRRTKNAFTVKKNINTQPTVINYWMQNTPWVLFICRL